jgi:hypothetical protein
VIAKKEDERIVAESTGCGMAERWIELWVSYL